MKWRIWSIAAGLGLAGLAGAFVFWGDRTKPLEGKKSLGFLEGSQVWIEGNSSLQRYYLTAQGLSVKSDLSTADSKAKTLLSLILNREGRKLTVAFPVKGLTSGDKGMDQQAHEKLKVKKYPDIVFTMGDYVIKAFPGSLTTYALLVTGKLRIAGVEREVVLEPTMVIGKDGINLYGVQDVYQKDFGISPYSVAVVMTTDNKIVVHYKIALGFKDN